MRASVAALLCCAALGVACAAESAPAPARTNYTLVSFPLQHAFGLGGGYSDAGEFSARAHAHPSTGAVRLSHAKLRRRDLSSDEQAALLDQAALGGPYRVRVPGSALDPASAEAAGAWAAAWLPASCLLASALAESWALHTDERGNVVALELAATGAPCAAGPPLAAPAARPQPPKAWAFASAVSVRLPKEMPRLSARPFDVEALLAAPEGAPPQEAVLQPPPVPKTFMERYGMVVMMVGVQVLMRAFLTPAPAAREGAAAAEGAPAEGTAAPAVAAAEGAPALEAR